MGGAMMFRGVLAIAAVAAAPLAAQAADQFFKGRTISIVVPADPGGSYDLYARLVATHMVKHLPGAPTGIVQNMPGAGGLRAINHLYSLAPKDGTVLQIPVQDIALSEALGRDGVDFKVANLTWIGRIAPSVDLQITWGDKKIRSIDEVKKREITIAATGPNSPTSLNPMVLNAVIGTKFKLISGYKSNAEMSAAMERGETDGAFATWSTMKTAFPGWIRERKIDYLVVYTAERIPELADVPAVTELADGKIEKQILALLASTGTLGRSLVTAPGVDPARVAELRGAFDAMVVDAAFLADVKRLNIEFGPLSGADTQKAISGMFDVEPSVIARTREIVQTVIKR